ncbi:MAG: polyphosphate polymerase domain-containing protein [Lachnospiraceae bacterium]|nr:polyphosphate polymerase domain-containing protein [Lachnospiraceae bacterium]
MANQMIFKRYELKYLLTAEQKKRVLEAMAPYMQLDQYGRDTIRNIYFDTDNFRLIRRSMEKPVYKEKLRLRSYRQVAPDGDVYVELKKKYNGVVYKRRLVMPHNQAIDCICEGKALPANSQISREIDYFCQFYEGIKPKVFLSYEREAYYSLDGSDFRVTFDENILYRQEDLSLSGAVYGTPLLAAGMTLMEIKTPGGIPLWMSKYLTEAGIYKTSFSKYGAAYTDMMQKETVIDTKGEEKYAS